MTRQVSNDQGYWWGVAIEAVGTDRGRCLAVYGEHTGGGLFECTNKLMYTNTNKPTQPRQAFFSVIRYQRTALGETFTYFYQLSLGAGTTWKSSRFLPLPVYDRKEGPDSNFSDNTALKGRRGYVLTLYSFTLSFYRDSFQLYERRSGV